jgi:hypothetical protein
METKDRRRPAKRLPRADSLSILRLIWMAAGVFYRNRAFDRDGGAHVAGGSRASYLVIALRKVGLPRASSCCSASKMTLGPCPQSNKMVISISDVPVESRVVGIAIPMIWTAAKADAGVSPSGVRARGMPAGCRELQIGGILRHGC